MADAQSDIYNVPHRTANWEPVSWGEVHYLSNNEDPFITGNLQAML